MNSISAFFRIVSSIQAMACLLLFSGCTFHVSTTTRYRTTPSYSKAPITSEVASRVPTHKWIITIHDGFENPDTCNHIFCALSPIPRLGTRIILNFTVPNLPVASGSESSAGSSTASYVVQGSAFTQQGQYDIVDGEMRGNDFRFGFVDSAGLRREFIGKIKSNGMSGEENFVYALSAMNGRAIEHSDISGQVRSGNGAFLKWTALVSPSK